MDVSNHAFAFMTTHYHLMVTPNTKSGLPRTMQRANGRHTKYFNREYREGEQSGTNVMAPSCSTMSAIGTHAFATWS